MESRLLGFFSGFPSRRFPEEIAARLREEITNRDSLVFISAWPTDYARNDSDATGMHGMFEACGMPFARYCVIDERTEAADAVRLIQEASCVFLMGGHPGLQFRLIREKGLADALRHASAATLGVSAGSINMAKHSLDTKESPVPYDGLGLADVTIKPHFDPANEQVLATLLQISMELPICATEDNSAIFVKDNHVSYTGRIHWVNKGVMEPFSQERLSSPSL